MGWFSPFRVIRRFTINYFEPVLASLISDGDEIFACVLDRSQPKITINLVSYKIVALIMIQKPNSVMGIDLLTATGNGQVGLRLKFGRQDLTLNDLQSLEIEVSSLDILAQSLFLILIHKNIFFNSIISYISLDHLVEQWVTFSFSVDLELHKP